MIIDYYLNHVVVVVVAAAAAVNVKFHWNPSEPQYHSLPQKQPTSNSALQGVAFPVIEVQSPPQFPLSIFHTRTKNKVHSVNIVT